MATAARSAVLLISLLSFTVAAGAIRVLGRIHLTTRASDLPLPGKQPNRQAQTGQDEDYKTQDKCSHMYSLLGQKQAVYCGAASAPLQSVDNRDARLTSHRVDVRATDVAAPRYQSRRGRSVPPRRRDLKAS